MDIIKILSKEFGLLPERLKSTVTLFDDGATVPFIARYRKEVTGSLDDQVLRELFERMTYLRNLEDRKAEVRAAISEQDKMTDEIRILLDGAMTLVEVEDIYRPYKQKRKTRASVARDKGLEPLAQIIFEQEPHINIFKLAREYISKDKGVLSGDEALDGARDIIAEAVSDTAEYRKKIRSITHDFAAITAKKASDEEKGAIYSMYFDYSEPVNKIPPHRILAMNRAEKEGFIRVSVDIDKSIPLNYLFSETVNPDKCPASQLVEGAVVDAYDRLIAPSIEREIRSDAFDAASETSIKLFSVNLKNLLLTPPLKGKNVLGFDPGYRTGCKLAVVDQTGKVLDTGVVYPTKPHEDFPGSERIITQMIRRHKIDIVAIGNGTASKESEIFIATLLKKIGGGTKYVMVSESGASVYSASKLGAEEFPEYDVTIRSAVSIARRLQDPLAEFVKIDPKSIGVGQYQHDMKPARLDEALGGVVEDCVNSVGVDINTASHSLLSYVSGISAAAAKNIVKYREENGEFRSRMEIKKTPRIGAKAFEQCAGFLRIPSAKEVLDTTGIHPESYEIAKELLDMYDYTAADVRKNRIKGLFERVAEDDIYNVADKLGIGVPTLTDMIRELEKPGRDIRETFPEPILRDDIMELSDIKIGMEFTGTVRNVIDFGAFVDIGVHQDGLVHVSQISEKFVRHPSEMLAVGDIVKVAVLNIDSEKKKIALTMKGVAK